MTLDFLRCTHQFVRCGIADVVALLGRFLPKTWAVGKNRRPFFCERAIELGWLWGSPAQCHEFRHSWGSEVRLACPLATTATDYLRLINRHASSRRDLLGSRARLQ